MRLRCSGIFNDCFIVRFTAESDAERILKIGYFGEVMGKSRVSCSFRLTGL